MNVELKILDQRIAEEPLKYATDGSCAADLRACSNVPIDIYPGDIAKIGTGVALHLGSAIMPDCQRLAGLVLPRSGLASRGITIVNYPAGLIDADYTGEIIAALRNDGDEPFRIYPLDRIAQLLIVPVALPRFRVVEEFTATTARGAGGFGSTGVA